MGEVFGASHEKGSVKIPPRWWESADGGRAARCRLCLHECLMRDGQSGLCGARTYGDGVFSSPFLGLFTSVAVDPIEKKPLRRWRPGTSILSLGSVGCNMRCPFCQNHAIAQPEGNPPLTGISPTELAALARRSGTNAVAYTYNEPTLQAEYILEAAPTLKDAGIAAVLVSNGMISPEALADLAPWIDAANIDVKTFDEAAYQRLGGSLRAVKETVGGMIGSGVHVELTNLIVPGVSDSPGDFEKMVDWIASLSPGGRDIPLHISRYFPAHKFAAPATNISLLRDCQSIALKQLRHVYLGNA